ncbi:MAG: crossover junction endodeoxyribonuclease RuvC [Spirochaetales bacterium]
MTRVLGVDPGLAATGWGVVDADGSRNSYVAHGTIDTPAADQLGARLSKIYDELTAVVRSYNPAAAGIEQLYFARNTSSALPVAHARGVVLLGLEQRSVAAFEYPPQEIKQSIVGSGRATKEQVQEMVRVLLGLNEVPKPNHSADALAAALCHIAHAGAMERFGV